MDLFSSVATELELEMASTYTLTGDDETRRV